MRPFIRSLMVLLSLLAVQQLHAQNTTPSLNLKPWNAGWICAPNDPGQEYGVYYYRKTIDLAAKPASFVVHVSADNRYKLYVNGQLISLGPARSDTYFWNYETVDLASYLTTGKNIIAALVWNEAQYRPAAQITIRTAFILQGDTKAEQILNTNKSWKCIRDTGHRVIPGFFFAASRGEMVDMNQAVKGDWTAANFDDSAWHNAAKVADGRLKGMSWGDGWHLVPATLPQREMTYQRIPVLRSAVGMQVPSTFPGTKAPITIPANSLVTLLLDQTYETNAYVSVNFSGGKGAAMSLGYAESLYIKGTKAQRKGNRNNIDGEEFFGRIDSLVSNGSDNQSYTTLNFRTYRYMRLIIRTQNEPLVINDLYGTFTGYPFTRTAVFNTTDDTIKQILDIGWRTARLNAWETYTDCPYYEQLQYIGDTRIQALISYYNTPDDRLARNALDMMDHSRLAEGITHSCYPSNGTQIISTFSLWYICMLHDYWMYRGDDKFIKDKLVGERGVLDFFSKYQQADGSLKNTPYWAFVDWAGNFAGGIDGPDGSAAIYDLQLLWAYQWAAEMEAKIGMPDFAKLYTAKAAQLKATINRKYWDPVRGLYADNISKKDYSQHANSLAILTGTAPQAQVAGICQKMLTDKSLTQCTIYFKYYLHQALIKGGLGDDYNKWLGKWRENIQWGLTTWAEYSDVATTRSDCHAWGSSPNIEFFRTVLGIDSYAPGFKKIKIEPHLGTMTDASGEIPHPDGKVAVKYKMNGGKWNISIDLPQSTSGILVWKAKTYPLKAGSNSFVI